MGISCSCNEIEGDWWFYDDDLVEPLNTKRSRKCASCGAKISIGEDHYSFPRYRHPLSEIEERICGTEVQLTPLRLCESCGDLYYSIVGAGFCVSLGGDSSIKEDWLKHLAWVNRGKS